jgi:actin-related protein
VLLFAIFVLFSSLKNRRASPGLRSGTYATYSVMYQVEGAVPSIVLDAGSHTVKAGISGEDLPHVLTPSVLSVQSSLIADGADPRDPTAFSAARLSDAFTARPQKNVDVVSPFGADGLVDHWPRFEALVGHTLKDQLQVDSSEHAILYAEPNHNRRAARERLVELFFETFSVPAVYLARSAVLAAYASGRTTGIVVDMGHSGISAVPVLEGALVKDKFLRTDVGGAAVSAALRTQLAAAGTQLRPLWSFKRSVLRGEDGQVVESSATPVLVQDVADTYNQFAVMRILEDVKAGICRVYDTPRVDISQVNVPEASWELPDGNVVRMSAEKFAAAEQTLFSALPHVSHGANSSDVRLSYVQQMVKKVGSNGVPIGGSIETSRGVDGLVLDAIRLCDSSTHRDMYAGVCLTGGASDMGGVYERLTSGLAEAYHKVRVLAATGSLERKYCAWTGGSILGTFSEFQRMWMSKSEYEENGASFVHKKST